MSVEDYGELFQVLQLLLTIYKTHKQEESDLVCAFGPAHTRELLVMLSMTLAVPTCMTHKNEEDWWISGPSKLNSTYFQIS